MSSGTVHEASVTSLNFASFSAPYQGPQHARLVLRTHPRWGKAVIFSIEKGQLLCSSYDGCSVLVRFDDGKAQTYSAQEPADNSTETLFISNYARFLAGLQKAKRVKLSVNVYQEGSQTFDFDVSGFSTAEYRSSPMKSQATPGKERPVSDAPR